MVPFILIGGIGLVAVLVSLFFGEILDLLDGAISMTAIGSAFTVFGAVGAIVIANGLPDWSAHVISAVLGILGERKRDPALHIRTQQLLDEQTLSGFAGLVARGIEQGCQAGVLRIRRHHHQEGEDRDGGDGGVVVDRPVSGAGHHRAGHHVTRCGQQQGVAVGLGAPDIGRGDRAAGAGHGLHHHRLTESLLDLGAHEAGDDVGIAAWGEALDQLHRPVRVGFTMGRQMAERTQPCHGQA